MEARELKDKASALFTKGRFAKAAETYEEFCVLDKRDHQARLRCGDAWSKAGKKDKAIASYSLAAEGYAKDGFLPRAIAASKLVLEIDPSHKGVQKMLAELYAQKSGGSRPSGGAAKGSSPSAVAAAPGAEMEVTRSVAAPVTSSFTHRKNAIDLDAPLPEKAKPTGYRPAATEAPSPMNRADALELPEYEIPMDDGPSHVGGMAAAKGPAPERRPDAIEIDMQDAGDSGPKALVETSIDIELSSSQPAMGEVEVPIEGQPLTDADQLPPESQVVSFDLAAPPPPPLDFELDVPAPSAPSGQVYELTEELPEAKPSAPIYDLTDEAEAAAPEPAPPPSFSIEEPSAPLVVSGVPELAVPVPPSVAPVVASEVAAQQAHSTQDLPGAPVSTQEPVAPAMQAPATPAPAKHAPAISPSAATYAPAHATRSNALPPAVGDAASAPPSIRPMAASEGQPPGLKPRRAEAAAPEAPANVPSSSTSSRIWLPPAFTPAAARAEGDAPRPAVEATAPVTAALEPSTDLERSLQTFMEFDPDAPAPRPAAAPQPPPAHASFTELDLDESDSLLHSIDAAASSAAPQAAVVEEAMEPDDSHVQQGGLPKIPLFSDLPEDAFIALFEKCPLQRFEEGQLVFEEGDKADAFFVICAGQVRVFRTDAGARRDLATLDEGSFFGEMALLSEAPRSASVEAGSEDTQVLVISAEILKELSSSYPVVATALKKFCRQRMLSNLMNQAALFAPFNKNDRRDLVQKFRARDVNKGDVLVKEGASSDGLYLVLSGEVEVEAKGRRIATLKEGQVFGEMSLLMRSPASATVRALRHTSLLRLPKHDFDSLILSHPQVLEHVASLIDERKKADQKRQ